MRNTTRHTIWSSEINLDDWREDLLEYYADDLDEDASESDFYALAEDINSDYLDDERCNLDIDVDGDIFAFCEIGAWDGRHFAAGKVGNNISDCLYTECPIAEWYVENGDFCSMEAHHDGRNYTTYRMLKTDLTDKQIDNFWAKLAAGEITPNNIDRYTVSLAPQIAAVYGWTN